MQLDTPTFLKLVEDSGKLAFVDGEMAGLNPDYTSLICVAIKPYGKEAKEFHVEQFGNDQKLVRMVRDELEKYVCWVTYYGALFDIKFMQSRLLKWKLPQLPVRHHIDMYWKLKYALNPSRRSQAHLLRWFESPTQKMDLSPDVWCAAAYKGENVGLLVERCKSDAAGLEMLYERTKHLIRDVKRF